MKNIYTKISLVVTPVIAAVIMTSCMSGQTAGDAGAVQPVTTSPNDIRTSSDMNISPANVNTSDPAIKMQEDSLKTTPAGPGNE